MIRQQFLTGTPIIQLLKIMKGQHIELTQWRNVLRLFLVGALASIYSLRDNIKYRRAIEATEIANPPIFILGHWRSGTTLLQTLLSLDKCITTPTFFQCTFPQGFLSVGSSIKQKFENTIPPRRLFDAMPFTLDSPFDDEMAILKFTSDSMMLDFVFPENHKNTKTLFRYSSNWSTAMEHFAKKITFATGKRIVFKSPVHSYRVDEIKKLFPGAKFIIMIRNPADVFLSSKHHVKKLLKHNALHDSSYDVENYITRRYQEMHTSLEGALKNLDQNQFITITYDKLVSDTLGTVESIYKYLNMENWETSRAAIVSWLEGQKEYKPNIYSTTEEMPREWILWSIDYNSNNFSVSN